jgi:hypothetical protein
MPDVLVEFLCFIEFFKVDVSPFDYFPVDLFMNADVSCQFFLVRPMESKGFYFYFLLFDELFKVRVQFCSIQCDCPKSVDQVFTQVAFRLGVRIVPESFIYDSGLLKHSSIMVCNFDDFGSYEQ